MNTARHSAAPSGDHDRTPPSHAATALFNPSDPQLRVDPYPTYRKMREQEPALCSGAGVWYFTRYSDCFGIFRNSAVSYDTTAATSFLNGLSKDPTLRAAQLTEAQRNRSVLDVDPPEHTRLRALLTRGFTVQSVEASRGVIEQYVDDLISGFDADTVDLVSRFALPLPVMVISEMLGVPEGERDEFLAIGNRISRSVDPDVPVTENLAANLQLREYISSLIDRQRGTPGDNIITRLIAASEDGRLATNDELITNIGILLIAGFETTTNLITNTIFRLLEHPDQLAALRADARLIQGAIEEGLRFDPPSQLMRPRSIAADTEIAGVPLRPGDPIVPVLAAANRDPEQFPDPESFDILRSPNRHMSFGLGHHRCLGASLARAEAQIAVLAIVQRYPKLALAPDKPPEYRPNLQLRGFSSLPVVLSS